MSVYLHPEMWQIILDFLPLCSLPLARFVCRQWRDMIPPERFARTYRIDYCRLSGEVASRGWLDCLQFIHKNGCLISERTVEMASSRGQLETVKWLIEKMNCRFNWSSLYWASRYGKIEVLEYLAKLPCMLCYCTLIPRNTTQTSSLRCACKWRHRVLEVAVTNGKWSVLNWIKEDEERQKTFPIDAKVLRHALARGRVAMAQDILLYSQHRRDIFLDAKCLHKAAGAGQIRSLKWIERNSGGYDDVDNRIEINEDVMLLALKSGKMDCISWCHERCENPLPEDWVYLHACQSDNPEVIEWLLSQSYFLELDTLGIDCMERCSPRIFSWYVKKKGVEQIMKDNVLVHHLFRTAVTNRDNGGVMLYRMIREGIFFFDMTTSSEIASFESESILLFWILSAPEEMIRTTWEADSWKNVARLLLPDLFHECVMSGMPLYVGEIGDAMKKVDRVLSKAIRNNNRRSGMSGQQNGTSWLMEKRLRHDRDAAEKIRAIIQESLLASDNDDDDEKMRDD